TPTDPLTEPTSGIPYPGEYVTRYVQADGRLTDQATEADVMWLPKIRCEILSGKHVRFLPATARDVWEADGLLVASMVPLGILKSMFAKVAEMTPEQIKALVSDRPVNYEDLLPSAFRPSDAAITSNKITDTSLVFTLTVYYK